jgi:catechol 2,3-dioxygenase-like lactoylglutathione lyase family enzyme
MVEQQTAASESEATERVQVVFRVGDTEYSATLKPFEIVHDGIHHAIPEDIRRGHHLVLRGPKDEEVYPDMFAGEVVRGYGDGESVVLTTTITPIASEPGPWRNIGFDHLAIAVEDREGACQFFSEVLGMQIARHDPHMTVLTTGHTGLFLFDTGEGIPMSDGTASRWHHLGFVVDNLSHAYWDLQRHASLVSDFTLLERQERWSLYGHYRNGSVNFMIQLSEIREGWRGFPNPEEITDYLYNYAGQRYGKRLEQE